VRRRNRVIWLAINELASRSEFPEWHARCTTDLSTQVSGATQQAFDAAVKAAETGCLVSNLFGAGISVDAQLDAAS
jgi:hypothetical protein